MKARQIMAVAAALCAGWPATAPAQDLQEECERVDTLNDAGDFADAETLSQEIAARGLPLDEAWTIDCRYFHAEALRNLNRVPEAEAILRPALADAQRRNLPHLYIAGLNRLTTLLSEAGRLGEAESLAREALAQLDMLEAPDPENLAKARNNLLGVLGYQGRYEEALEAGEGLPEFVDQTLGPAHETAIVSRSLMAAMHGMLFDYDRSIALYEELVPKSAAALGEDHRDHLIVLNNLASLYLQTGRYDEAEELFDRVLAIRLQTLGETHFDTSVSYENIARLHMARGDLAKAEPLVLRLIALRRATLGPTHRNLASAWLLLGEYFRASDAPPEASIFAYKQGIGVLQAIQANMTDLPDTSRGSFAYAWVRAYDTLQDWLIAEGRFAEAEEIGNLFKTAEYVEFVRGEGDFNDPRPPSMTVREEAWAAQFEDWVARPNLAAAALREEQGGTVDPARLETLRAAYDEAYSGYRTSVGAWLNDVRALDDQAARDEAQALQLQQSERMQGIVADLGDDVALLQIAALPDAVHLFLITPDAFVHRSTPIAREDVFAALFEQRDAIIVGGRYGLTGDAEHTAQVTQLGQELYDALLRPVAQELEDAGTRVLMLNLQGQMRYLPFAALHDGEGWLAERFALTLYSSAAPARFDGFDALDSGAGFGVSQAVEGFSPLPAVPRELEAVMTGNDAAGALQGEFVLDADFTSQRLEASLAGENAVIHVASHFAMNAGNAEESFLLLGDGSRLTLSDINLSPRLRFRGVELVTLSACETAIAGGGNGLEIDGLGTLIQNKGADSVMATLWSVSDNSTADLMIAFYDGMTSGGLDKASALQAAQITLIRSEEGADPFFWAPFVLMGDWK